MTRSIMIAAALALAVTLPAAPAYAAGVGRTFLSAAGSDSNNCANVLTPCRHLATAFAATAQDGEIYVLDPANYGSLTITHGVSIEGHGWASIAPTSGGNAITINANAGDAINIIGVVLDGTALTGTIGIRFNSGGSLNVQDSIIRKFGLDGIDFNPGASAPPSQIVVSNTLVSDNTSDGIDIAPNGGSVKGVLDHVKMQNNGLAGLDISTFAPADITVTDSVIANNVKDGIDAVSFGPSLNVMVRNSTIANNGGIGLNAVDVVVGAIASIRATRSTITGNGTGWAIGTNGGAVTSYADNNIEDNGSVNTAPTQIGYK